MKSLKGILDGHDCDAFQMHDASCLISMLPLAPLLLPT